MIKVAICDDNELQRDLLEEMLEIYQKNSFTELQISCFGSAKEMLDHIRDNGSFDIYLLDLIMPEMNGMEAAAMLRLMKDNGKIIFLTSTVEYAVASYDVDAFYYMLKPIDRERFFKVFKNALESIATNDTFIIVRSRGKDTRINADDLMYVGLSNRVPYYYINDGRVLEGVMLRGSFKEAIEPLTNDPRFSMCGVSLIVNMKYVDAVDSDSVLLHDGTQLFLPKSAYAAFRKLWKESR